MSSRSILLLNDTSGVTNITGDAIRAPGYYSSDRNVITIAVYLNNFVGRLYIEASLANNPEEDDWFPINLNGYIPYAEYPNDFTNNDGVESFSFELNAIWIRARQDRSYLPNPEENGLGSIKKILINF